MRDLWIFCIIYYPGFSIFDCRALECSCRCKHRYFPRSNINAVQTVKSLVNYDFVQLMSNWPWNYSVIHAHSCTAICMGLSAAFMVQDDTENFLFIYSFCLYFLFLLLLEQFISSKQHRLLFCSVLKSLHFYQTSFHLLISVVFTFRICGTFSPEQKILAISNNFIIDN